MKLPRSSLSQPAFLSSQSLSAPAPATNRFVEIFADFLTLTNGPQKSFVAETNVVVLDQDGKSRATGSTATYQEAAGLIELHGNPEWRSEQRLLKGDVLTFDRTHQEFSAHGHAYLKFPAAALQKTAVWPAQSVSTNGSPPLTNQFVEILSDHLEYRSDRLRFQEQVKANYLENDQVLGWMTCGLLALKFSNHIERLEAHNKVAIQAGPRTNANGKTWIRMLHCESLAVNFSTNGQMRNILAEQNVVAWQSESRPVRPKPILTTLKTDLLMVDFFAHTNRIETARAAGRVQIAQDQRTARSGQGVYRGTNDLLELTGQPTATLPEGEITEAAALLWNRTNQAFIAKGKYKSEWKRWSGQTNLLNLRLRP